jgi:hypothetical protein
MESKYLTKIYNLDTGAGAQSQGANFFNSIGLFAFLDKTRDIKMSNGPIKLNYKVKRARTIEISSECPKFVRKLLIK